MNKTTFQNEFNYIDSFPPLGHPEHHFHKYPNHPWLYEREEINNWLQDFGVLVDDFIIHDDLTVSSKMESSIDLSSKNLTHIPFKFRNVSFLNAIHNSLTLLSWMPYNSDSVIASNNLISSWEGLDNCHIEELFLNRNGFTSFKGMPNLKDCKLFLFGNPIESWNGINCNTPSVWNTTFESYNLYEFLEKVPENISAVLLPYSATVKNIISEIFLINLDGNSIHQELNAVNMKLFRTFLLKEKLNNDNLLITKEKLKRRKL